MTTAELHSSDTCELSQAQKEVMDRILSLADSKRKRIFELVDLHEESHDEGERAEIRQVLYEVLFPEPKQVEAVSIDDEPPTDEAKEGIQKHRTYIAKEIKKQRTSRGWTQEQLAAKAGMLQSHICSLEAGKHAPTYLTIQKIAKAFGIPAGEIDPSLE